MRSEKRKGPEVGYQVGLAQLSKTEIDTDGVFRRLDAVPDPCGVIQDVASLQSYFGALFNHIFRVVPRTKVDALIRLVDLVLKFQVARAFEVGREAGDGSFHAWLDAELPLFGALKLNREVFLEVHVPVCIVSLATNKRLNFPSGVPQRLQRLTAREVAGHAVAHLMQQQLAPAHPHF